MADEVLIDISRLVWRAWENKLPTGIDRTCLAYVRHFRDRARAVVQRGGFTSVMSPAASRRLFDLLTSGAPVSKPTLGRRVAEGLTSYRRGKVSGLIYLNVGHTGLDRPGHGEWVRQTAVKPIYFVHDLIPLTHPEYCRPAEPERHLRRMKSLLSLGDGVIANSRQTLNELGIFAGLQKSLRMPLGLVAPLGFSHRSSGAGMHMSLPAQPYFVMLGTIEGRKNHLLILNIWATMARSLGPKCPQLIIIGQRGWECEQVVDMLERSEVIRRKVIELPRCDDEQLANYLNHARALLFPSFAEGYGLPLVEALAAGAPVIASDLEVFRELAGEIPDYLSPLDGLGWQRLIEDYAQTGSKSRADQLTRMGGWKGQTWEQHFIAVDRWLNEFIQPL